MCSWADTLSVRVLDKFRGDGVSVQTAQLDFGTEGPRYTVSVKNSEPFELPLDEVRTARRLILELGDGTTWAHDLKRFCEHRGPFMKDEEVIFVYDEPKQSCKCNLF